MLLGCATATVTLPGEIVQTTTTIDYTYDPLCRLTAADYSTGDYYHYAYDAVGNRLQQDSSVKGLQVTDNYQYDIANRLTSVNGVNYAWDANGNLLNDGANIYTYDATNRLTSFTNSTVSAAYSYNGLVVNAGIDHRGAKFLVSQKLLKRSYPATGIEQLRRHRMAKAMRMDLNSHALADGLQPARDQIPAQSLIAEEKDMLGGSGTTNSQVFSNCPDSGIGCENHAILHALRLAYRLIRGGRTANQIDTFNGKFPLV